LYLNTVPIPRYKVSYTENLQIDDQVLCAFLSAHTDTP